MMLPAEDGNYVLKRMRDDAELRSRPRPTVRHVDRKKRKVRAKMAKASRRYNRRK